MKKFLITLLILIVLGSAGFFFGWAQLSVPHGQYGVITSKTHGVAPDLVRSGEFRWIWYKLIPTNVVISVYKLEPATYQINYSNSLPMGLNYASFAGLTNVNFSWNIHGEFSLSIDPEKLIQLVSRHNIINQHDLDEYLTDVSQEIEVIILRHLAASADNVEKLERIMAGNLDLEMEREIYERLPEITNFTFIVNSADYPDFILYRTLRQIYEDFLTHQREQITADFGRRAEMRIESQLRFEELERYGELLTRYPILLDYLSLELDNSN